MGLLKFLVVAIAILWIVRVVARLLFPWAMRKMAEKVMGNAQQQQQYRNGPYNNGRNYQPRTPDGKVRIDYVPPQDKPKRGAQRAGEFVEFEEVKSSTK
ncbi:DUF4834 family protein [Parapedobacter sp. DT-150]|uniref:DUF4834 family protein n=1 Tax=Parapedobacter sp. DT-150 TaxID=3396162 RepID=UPI003F1B737B